MTTELIGQSQAIDESAQAEGETAYVPSPSPHAARIGESILRTANRLAGADLLRWIEAWVRVGNHDLDLAQCTDAELDRQVKTALRIVDVSNEGGSERLARELGL